MDLSEDSKLLGIDRISQLPDVIIDKILIKLPTADAARTSILSRKWKNGWISISQLKFDPSFAAKCYRVDHKNLILAMYAILMIHSGPITAFKLDILFQMEISEIDRVFHFLSRKGVQELDINIPRRGTGFYDVISGYILPSHFYSCLQLRHLKIDNCTINPPCNFGGFRNLGHLELLCLDLTHSVLENLIAKCPLLEQLIIELCNFKESSVMKINASNLKRCYLNGVRSCFRFISVPLLKSLTWIDLRSVDRYGRRSPGYEGVEKSSLEEFCNALPALEYLTLDYYFLQTLVVLNMSSTYGRRLKWLHRLKSLTVYHVGLWNMDEVTSLLGLIGSSPNLNVLNIEMDLLPYGEDNPLTVLERNHLDDDFSCKKLEVVTLSKMGGHDSEIDFVKLVLLKSPQLKTMHIRAIKYATPSIRVKIQTKVNQFRRASATAEVDFGGCMW